MTEPAQRPRLEELKIALLSRGVSIDPIALRRLGGPESLTAHEYATTGGIPFRLGDVYVNAAFDESYSATSRVHLAPSGEGYVLLFDGDVFEIDEVVPLPGYLGAVDSKDRPIADVAFSHFDRVRLSPITGCAYDCAFCDLPGRISFRPLEQLLEAADVALADTTLPARHLLISGGSPGPKQWSQFVETVAGLVAALGDRVPVDVMMSSGPGTPEFVDQLIDAGVHGFALNIEIESDAAAQVHIRGKHRRARPYFDETVSAAVSRLGRTGRVRSLILPGLEPVEATLQGVAHLAELGADPVLSPFRPAQDTALVGRDPVSENDLHAVLVGARAIVAEHGVALGPRCLPCQHNTLTFPWDIPSP